MIENSAQSADMQTFLLVGVYLTIMNSGLNISLKMNFEHCILYLHL